MTDFLRVYDFTLPELDAITSITVAGVPSLGTGLGPFTRLPADLCLFRNLEKIRFASNQIRQVDPSGALTSCLPKVTAIYLSGNRISVFPSEMIHSMTNLQEVVFSNNQLTEVPGIAFSNPSTLTNIDFSFNRLTTFEFWTFYVNGTVNFANNQIASITNKYFFDLPYEATASPSISLVNNAPLINLTDAIYEMYNACDEIENVVLNNNYSLTTGMLSLGLRQINFGRTQINCSCDQNFIQQFLSIISGGFSESLQALYPLYNTSCTDGSFFARNECSIIPIGANSTADFVNVYPRQCKIYDAEPGELSIKPNFTIPTTDVSAYPHHITDFVNPGACFLTFVSSTNMTVRCTADTSDTTSSFSSNLLSNPYMASITRVNLPTAMRSLPRYLCSLPSRSIDLSYQNFTTLTTETFPCLDNFRYVSLTGNQLSSVNMPSGNFSTLTTLDLSYNYLTSIPHSILRPSPSSLRTLDLSHNQITAIDAILFTVRNISVDLTANPINSSTVVNPMNITIPTGTRNNTSQQSNITWPQSALEAPYLINDQQATAASSCDINVIENFFSTTRLSNQSAMLVCTCQSVSLKFLYNRVGMDILDHYNCSDTADTDTFRGLTLVGCAIRSNLYEICTATTSTSQPATPSLSNSPPSTSNASLIGGLVGGLVGGALLAGIAAGAGVYFYKKKKAARSEAKNSKKTVNRAKVLNQAPEKALLGSRVSTRNPRTLQLAPLTTGTSKLPPIPVSTIPSSRLTAASTLATATATATTTTTTTTATVKTPITFGRSETSVTAKGIPTRLDPIRTPTHITLQQPFDARDLLNQSSFRPIEKANVLPNLPSSKTSLDTSLNIGGDNR